MRYRNTLAAAILAALPVSAGASSTVAFEIAEDRHAATIDSYLPWQDETELAVPISGFFVTVEVSWTRNGRDQQIILNSLRVQKRPLEEGLG